VRGDNSHGRPASLPSLVVLYVYLVQTYKLFRSRHQPEKIRKQAAEKRSLNKCRLVPVVGLIAGLKNRNPINAGSMPVYVIRIIFYYLAKFCS
jgi:hypothetical protein